MANIFRKWKNEGIPLRAMNQVIAGLVIVLTALMVVSIVQSFLGFEKLQSVSNRHAKLRNSSYELQLASDYLTEQARCFAVCGEREHLDNYFEEANVTRRRDRALEELQKELGDTEPYQALQRAMAQSINLMDTEYYSMRLAAEARNEDLSTYPEIIQNQQLTEADQQLSAEGKAERARNMVFDENYHEQKKIISENMQSCLEKLDQILEDQEQRADSAMTSTLVWQCVMMALLVLSVLGAIYINTRMLIHPLVRAVDQIRNNELLDIGGAHEIRYLADTYNQVYGVNQEQAERLSYEASHDKLTGLNNRNSFDLVMEGMKNKDYALMLIDVDRFKLVNDNRGHAIGDQALIEVGRVLKHSFRDKDYVFRIGGDEFAVIIQNVDNKLKEMITAKVDRINRQLENEVDENLRTSVSVGVTFCGEKSNYETLFHEADMALYQAKKKGRRRCAFYEDLD